MRRALPHECEPWSAADRERLVAAYMAGGIEEAVRQFPTRSRSSLYHRASRSNAIRKRRWTAREKAKLRLLWGSVPIQEIVKELGRTRTAIMYFACYKLKLPSGCPSNLGYLTDVAKRLGFNVGQLRKILRWAGVALQESYTFRREGLQRWLVDPLDAEDAVTDWLATESLEAGARRLGTSAETLKLWLDRIGVRPKRWNGRNRKAHQRVSSEDIDRAWKVRAEFYAAHPGKKLPRWTGRKAA